MPDFFQFGKAKRLPDGRISIRTSGGVYLSLPWSEWQKAFAAIEQLKEAEDEQGLLQSSHQELC